MSDDEFIYTEERARGALFVGAITDAMIERAGRALCAHENAMDRKRSRDLGERHVELAYEDWKGEYEAQARIALVAALDEEERRG